MGNRDNERGRRDEVFIRESGPGRIPGQRWSGGYGGDRDDRHFGNAVDRGGRMGPAGEESSGREVYDLETREHEEERGPYWGKGPKGYKRDDSRTRDEVCDAIAYDGHIDAADVEVKVADGVVTLTGTVPLRDHKRKIERLVESCRGVHEVHNQLRLGRHN